MNTLATPEVAATLQRLFSEAAVISPESSLFLSRLDDAERARLMRSKTDYASFYHQLRHLPLAVSRQTGELLYMLARAGGARSIIEFGTSFGVSALYLASALRDNGGGRLISTEFEASKIGRAREALHEAKLLDIVELREGDALQTLAGDLPDEIDLLFLDGAKGLYPEVLQLVQGRLRPGAMVVADDAATNPDYQQYMRQAGNGYRSIPLGDGLELSLRLG
ncbi:O-methyltransferase [Herbaspirillum sp. YR522]|uniref:O-methyltransferase n=1 Tax=Herbaspirillum sp. YR522 TaxID=1144342 RepID=UPI00026F7617|nr:class I SAM-dependent methyltransferase [Herbaspirillum sp. YR522]EJN09996.1 putative O-methyltransferase [Herbaspirillum sp. YR522]